MAQNETGRLGLPLLQPAQAQKHVTVNEALVRLDGFVNLVLQSISQSSPPSTVIDGQCWGIPSDGQGAWAGNRGCIAIGSNGGWIFAEPSWGMSAFVADRGLQARYNGTTWVSGALILTSIGSGLSCGTAEAEISMGTGSSFATDLLIPAGAMVIGAVARVASAITGSLSGWQLGTAGYPDRFGKLLGTAEGSWARGMLGTPMTYYQTEPLILTAEGGTFAGGGRLKLAVHWWELRLPDA